MLAGIFLVAGLSSLALPGLSSFVSEFLVLVGTFERYPWVGVIATLGIVLAALYILLMYQRTMTGPSPTCVAEKVHDLARPRGRSRSPRSSSSSSRSASTRSPCSTSSTRRSTA